MEIAKKLKGKKGLTLIELLAVLVIVGIIAAIAVPAIGGTISKSKDRADRASQIIVKDAAIRFATDRVEDSMPSSILVFDNGATTDDLVGLGYLSNEPKFNNNKYKPNSVTISVSSTGAITATFPTVTGFEDLTD